MFDLHGLVAGVMVMVIVKSVISGDSLVLRGRAVNGPPPEKLVSLHGISCPRKDNSFYFESKDFLRKLVIGKNVEFISHYKNTREIGDILLDGESISKLIVRNGWATVKSNDSSDLVKELLELEKMAKLEKIGIYSSVLPITISLGIDEELKSFLEKNRDKQIPGTQITFL